jgi:hypothetical protein
MLLVKNEVKISLKFLLNLLVFFLLYKVQVYKYVELIKIKSVINMKNQNNMVIILLNKIVFIV